MTDYILVSCCNDMWFFVFYVNRVPHSQHRMSRGSHVTFRQSCLFGVGRSWVTWSRPGPDTMERAKIIVRETHKNVRWNKQIVTLIDQMMADCQVQIEPAYARKVMQWICDEFPSVDGARMGINFVPANTLPTLDDALLIRSYVNDHSKPEEFPGIGDYLDRVREHISQNRGESATRSVHAILGRPVGYDHLRSTKQNIEKRAKKSDLTISKGKMTL